MAIPEIPEHELPDGWRIESELEHQRVYWHSSGAEIVQGIENPPGDSPYYAKLFDSTGFPEASEQHAEASKARGSALRFMRMVNHYEEN